MYAVISSEKVVFFGGGGLCDFAHHAAAGAPPSSATPEAHHLPPGPSPAAQTGTLQTAWCALLSRAAAWGSEPSSSCPL